MPIAQYCSFQLKIDISSREHSVLR